MNRARILPTPTMLLAVAFLTISSHAHGWYYGEHELIGTISYAQACVRVRADLAAFALHVESPANLQAVHDRYDIACGHANTQGTPREARFGTGSTTDAAVHSEEYSALDRALSAIIDAAAQDGKSISSQAFDQLAASYHLDLAAVASQLRKELSRLQLRRNSLRKLLTADDAGFYDPSNRGTLESAALTVLIEKLLRQHPAGSEGLGASDYASVLRSSRIEATFPKAVLFGQMAAIAGDHIGTADEFDTEDAATAVHGFLNYTGLALANAEHFHPHVVKAWNEAHAGALTQTDNPAGWDDRVGRFRRILNREAFANHFLADSFSAGHMGFNREETTPSASIYYHDALNMYGRSVESDVGEADRWLAFGDGNLVMAKVANRSDADWNDVQRSIRRCAGRTHERDEDLNWENRLRALEAGSASAYETLFAFVFDDGVSRNVLSTLVTSSIPRYAESRSLRCGITALWDDKMWCFRELPNGANGAESTSCGDEEMRDVRGVTDARVVRDVLTSFSILSYQRKGGDGQPFVGTGVGFSTRIG